MAAFVPNQKLPASQLNGALDAKANQSDLLVVAASAGAAVAGVNAIANGTASDAGTLNGSEVITLSRGAGMLSKLLSSIAAYVNSVTGNASLLLSWAQVQNFQLISASRDSNGAITTANIVWPDGTPGVFTTDVASPAFPGAIDAWHATYAAAGGPKTVTQPAVTRDSNGAVSAQPAITIA